MGLKLVYLAGPIDMVGPDHAADWRETATLLLRSNGVGVYNPVTAWSLPGGFDPADPAAQKISHVNRCAVNRCDGMIANVNGPTIGTFREIELARDSALPVAFASYEPVRSVELWDLELFGPDAVEDMCWWMLEELGEVRSAG